MIQQKSKIIIEKILIFNFSVLNHLMQKQGKIRYLHDAYVHAKCPLLKSCIKNNLSWGFVVLIDDIFKT